MIPFWFARTLVLNLLQIEINSKKTPFRWRRISVINFPFSENTEMNTDNLQFSKKDLSDAKEEFSSWKRKETQQERNCETNKGQWWIWTGDSILGFYLLFR